MKAIKVGFVMETFKRENRHLLKSRRMNEQFESYEKTN